MSPSDKQGIVKEQEMTTEFGKQSSVKMISSHGEKPDRLTGQFQKEKPYFKTKEHLKLLLKNPLVTIWHQS